VFSVVVVSSSRDPEIRTATKPRESLHTKPTQRGLHGLRRLFSSSRCRRRRTREEGIHMREVIMMVVENAETKPVCGRKPGVLVLKFFIKQHLAHR